MGQVGFNSSVKRKSPIEGATTVENKATNEKIEEAGWKPIFTLDDGIKELIQSYKMIVPTQSQYRNTTPLSYKE